MKRVNDYVGLLEVSPESAVKNRLKSWQPNWSAKSEKQYEVQLMNWLASQFPDVPLVTQYGIAKGKADIVIEDRFVIELKLGFGPGSVAEFDRCIGQLERYKQKWVKAERGPVYLVVVGNSDSEFRNLLQTWIREANRSFLIDSPFHLIEKRKR